VKKLSQYELIAVFGAFLLAAGGVSLAYFSEVQARYPTFKQEYCYLLMFLGFILLVYGAYRYDKANKKYAGLRRWKQSRGLR
jgi:predicted ribosomally synthesized peptide with SipW-like signal peptide